MEKKISKTEEMMGTEKYQKRQERSKAIAQKKKERANRYLYFPTSDNYDWSGYIEKMCKNIYG